MGTSRKRTKAAGFTLVEIMMSMIVLGFVLISVAGVFLLFQKGAAHSTEYAEAQQNSRVAVDLITSSLRQAGSQTDYFRGQRPIVHAGPFQVALNADIDNGRTIDGLGPLEAINRAVAPNRVPAGGTPIYIPSEDFDSPAETVVFTLDSNDDGVISGSDRGDDPEEAGNTNRNLFVLKRMIYGFDGAATNEIRESNVALVRGPNLSPTWTIPQPLFKYWYDHDENGATPDLLWGDTDGSGELESAECLAIGPVPDALLGRIRRVQVTARSESDSYDKKYETNGGFLDVTMTSEVAVRNVSLTSAQIRGKVYHDADQDGIIDVGETGLPGVEVRLAGQNRTVITDNYGMFYFPLPAGTYSIQAVDPPGYLSTTANLVSVTMASGMVKMVNFGD
ncbi:MAG: SdrD B-like domain-containing protein [Candidatus Krumholzibacteria bacterium]|nr:SdrD B-like domain-containing protein [Candidatus Krumholzibacteria bacterium]